MFPVPKEKLLEHDFSKEDLTYRRLLMEEYKYCNTHEKEILDKAQYIYKSVMEGENSLMGKNCCDFAKLEAAADRYIDGQQTPPVPADPQTPPVPADPQTPLTAADIFEAVQEKATRISGETDRWQPEKGKIKGQEIE